MAAVLLASLGTKPQVVTTTLDLLQTAGASLGEVAILFPHTPQLDQAREQLRLEFERHAAYQGLHLIEHELHDETGPVPDVDSEATAQRTFVAVFQLLRALRMAEPQRPIHVSLVGGRKLLAIYALAAAQLIMGAHDRLWYTAVSAGYAASGRLHPERPEDARLVPVPLPVLGSASSLWLDPAAEIDPFTASAQQRERQLRQDLAHARAFVRSAISPAERRVLAVLVGDGASNQEIGERLHLSPRTVERHLGEIGARAALYWELPGPASRTQLVALLAPYFRLQAQGEVAGIPA
jgi:CRISPR-associated protein Csx14